MSDHEARARKLTFDRDLQREIVALLRTVRREALEEAAKVADAEASRYPDYDRFSHQAAALNSATQIAQAIRSLAVKEGER